MKVADLVVEALVAENVKYVFGVPGEEVEDLLFALDKNEKITFVPCRHEQGAAFIANVWGRLTGKAGVCLATLGPGATNLVTGVADANLDKAPMVAITGQGRISRLHHESHQLIDVLQTFKSITKWNDQIRSASTVTEVMRKAFKVAQIEKPGATHIELTEDIAGTELIKKEKPIEPEKIYRNKPQVDQIERSAKMIKSAKKPLILAGNGAIRSRSSKALCSFSDWFNIPVVSTYMGKGAISDRADQSLMTIGIGERDYVMQAFKQSDLIITIGYDIAESAPDNWNIGQEKKIIHIDFEPSEVYKKYLPEVELVGDIALTLEGLSEAMALGGFEPWGNWYLPIREQILNSIEGFRLTSSCEFTVPGLLIELREALPDDSIVISDVGTHKMWIARNFPSYVPNSCIISNGLASMGISLPGAIAASMVDPDRQIVAVAGDGGFLMNVQELETAVRMNCNFTVIVTVDDDYGLISWKQEQSRGDSSGTRLSNPDFVKLAESFGVTAYKPNGLDELQHILRTCQQLHGVKLIEVPISTIANKQLTDELDAQFKQKTIMV